MRAFTLETLEIASVCEVFYSMFYDAGIFFGGNVSPIFEANGISNMCFYFIIPTTSSAHTFHRPFQLSTGRGIAMGPVTHSEASYQACMW